MQIFELYRAGARADGTREGRGAEARQSGVQEALDLRRDLRCPRRSRTASSPALDVERSVGMHTRAEELDVELERPRCASLLQQSALIRLRC